MEAVAWHQLGRAFQEARQWDEAERHYRESARIEEERGNLAGAAQTWNQLASVGVLAGKPDASEMWYRKAIEGGQRVGDEDGLSKGLNNLADPCWPGPDGWPRRGNWRRRRWPSSRRSTLGRRRFGRPTTSLPRLRSRRRWESGLRAVRAAQLEA